MPKWLVYGTEPFLIDKYKKELIRDIEAPEFNYLEANEFTEQVSSFCARFPYWVMRRSLYIMQKHSRSARILLNFFQKEGKKQRFIFLLKR